jgi:hypothetical protein
VTRPRASAVVLVLALAACSQGEAPPAPRASQAADPARPSLPPAPPPATPRRAAQRCAWYTPATSGQVVIVGITGPGCHRDRAIEWIARVAGGPWVSTRLPADAHQIARLDHPGTSTVIRVYQTGFAVPTEHVSGFLLHDLDLAGWEPPK